jgi:hypothetical protein
MLETQTVQADDGFQMMRMKTCSGCRNKIASDFAFCRWCGQKQVVTLQRYLTEIETRMLDNSRRSYDTSPLASEAGVEKGTGLIHQDTLGLTGTSSLLTNNRFSGPLIKSVIEALQSQSLQASNIVYKKASTIMLSIFVSFLLILSAPIDAFVVAKNLIK